MDRNDHLYKILLPSRLFHFCCDDNRRHLLIARQNGSSTKSQFNQPTLTVSRNFHWDPIWRFRNDAWVYNHLHHGSTDHLVRSLHRLIGISVLDIIKKLLTVLPAIIFMIIAIYTTETLY